MSNRKRTKLLALDTSIKNTGFAVYLSGKLTRHGVISRKKTTTGADEMMCLLHDLIEKEKPDIVVVEMTVIVRNATTQRELTELIGSIRGHCLINDIYFYRIRPTEWRKLVKKPDEKLPKERNGLKFWSICTVKEKFGIEVKDDESDAILIGLAYIKMYEEE